MPSFTASTLALVSTLALTASAAPSSLDARQFGGGGGGGTTRNDLGSGPCRPTILIFARGTTEPGNMGVVVGPSLASALEGRLGGQAQVAVQGVEYAADWDGALGGGDKEGSAKMAQLITQAATQCPASNIVISGYSQGAQLVHNAANSLSADVAGKISSAVVFGDPYNPQPVRNVPTLLSVCFTDDNICARGGNGSGTGGHTAYGKETGRAADFIVKNLSSRAGGGAATAAPPAATPTTTTVTTAAPSTVPTMTPTATAAPAPGAGAGAGNGTGSANDGRPSLQDIIAGFLAAWGKGN